MQLNSGMRARLARVLMMIAFAVVSGGQFFSQAQERFQAGADFLTLIPRGEFKQNIDNNGYGVGGFFAAGLGKAPLFVGVDAGVVRYGSQTRRVPISPTIPEIRLRVTTTNNIALTHFLLRLQAREGKVRPYADGLIGFKYLVTRTSLRSDSVDENLASSTNFRDFTFSYGFGGGLQVRLGRVGRNGSVMLDGKFRYLRGSNAEYLREGSIRQIDGTVVFDVLSSRTDVATAQVGVAFLF